MGTGSEEITCLTPETVSLDYQTWVLKVSVHCQGCKRKVKKALQSMEGVYTASVDMQQQKVVVTGNVDAETLIKKLQKAGRHAELWPEKPKKEKENGNKDDNNNNKDNGGGKGANNSGKPRDKDPGAGEGGGTKAAEECSTATAAKAVPNDANAPSKSALNDKSPCPKGCGGGGRDCTRSSEGKDGGSSPPPLEKPAAGGGNADKANGGKKGKKGQKEGGIGATGGELSSESSGHTSNAVYSQLPTVYAVSYCTAYPSASSGAVYHATAPTVPPQHSVVYAARAKQQCPAYYCLPVAGVFIPPSDEELGSYDVFSDENAHACRVM